MNKEMQAGKALHKRDSERTLRLVQMALFTAIVILMAMVPGIGYIPIGPIRATIIHVPVIVGAILLGPKEGAILGGVFGLTSLINNTISPTVTSFVFSPFYSVGEVHGGIQSLIICFVPRILIGVTAYFTFRFIRKMMKESKGSLVVALGVAGVVGSLTNTLLVMNMIYFFFRDAYAAAQNVSTEALYGVIMTIIGTNGVPEAIVAAVIVTAIGKVFFRNKIK